MNSLVNCPGCGFTGRLPDDVASLRTIICPQCRTSIPIQQGRPSIQVDDSALPLSVSVDSPASPAPQGFPPPDDGYGSDYMREEATRFAQYVAARLGELHKRRLDLAEAENRFEAATMERKQDIHRQRGTLAAQAAQMNEHVAAIQAKEAALVAREAELAAREAEVAAREGRVARSEARATDTDRRTAELRAAIDALDARRAAVAEEKAALDQRAEALDRAELALHRRTAELDEMDERLRLEVEEFEQLKEQMLAAREQVG
jgi:chromosome segregation ATPase